MTDFVIILGYSMEQPVRKGMLTLSASTISIQRLHTQQLVQTNSEHPQDVVSWLAAVQAQDYPGAKWSLGLRLPPGAANCDKTIERAIANKTILRTTAMRGTLHFVTAADIRWLLALVAPHTIARSARRYRELELDEATLARSNRLLVEAMHGGEQLDRRQLIARLEAEGISTRGQRAAHMLQRAMLDGLICQSVMERNNPVYLSIEDSLPKSPALARDEAAAELAQRYFTSRGPATLQDFIWWSALPAAKAKAALEAIKIQLVQERIDGQVYWLSPAVLKAYPASPNVHLLPGFDEYLLSYRDRSASIDRLAASRLTNQNGMLSYTILIDGQVRGIWKRTLKKKGVVDIALTPFTEFTKVEKQAVAAAADRFAEFLGLKAAIRDS